MSDLVERVETIARKAIARDRGYAVGSTQYQEILAGKHDDIFEAEIELIRHAVTPIRAAMQTDAAPALKPAVEVWREAAETYAYPKVDEYGYQIAEWRREERAAAVIEADRAAIIAAKDAEIAALQAHADALGAQQKDTNA